jgi:flagellar biosynthesis protein FlhG
MYDQAQRLRQLVVSEQSQSQQSQQSTTSTTRVMTITSGKGGVGKSNFSLNYALGLAAKGKKVVVLDADVGFANIDVLLGKHPRKTLADLIQKKVSIWEILEVGPYGIQYIAGGSGLQQLIHLQTEQLNHLIGQLSELQGYADYLIIDTGAGLNEGTLRFILSSDDVIVVSTPEPTAITDAYALIKLVTRHERRSNIQLVINRASTITEGKQTAEKIALVTQKFLETDLQILGYVLDDPSVSRAVKEQVPFLIRYPESPAARCIEQLVKKQIKETTAVTGNETGIRSFLSRFIRVFRE